MMNFILGMGTMWILMSVAFFLLDCFKLDLWDNDRAYLRWLFLPIYLVATVFENLPGIYKVITCTDLVIKYKINPFKTSISEIKEKFSKEDKELYIKRVAGKNEKLAKRWRMALDI